MCVIGYNAQCCKTKSDGMPQSDGSLSIVACLTSMTFPKLPGFIYFLVIFLFSQNFLEITILKFHDLWAICQKYHIISCWFLRPFCKLLSSMAKLISQVKNKNLKSEKNI